MRTLQKISGSAVHVQTVSGDSPHRVAAIAAGGGGYGRATDYERLQNKPSIESVTLIGDKTFEELGLNGITNIELSKLLTL